MVRTEIKIDLLTFSMNFSIIYINLLFYVSRSVVKSISAFILGVRIAKEFVGTEVMPAIPQ